jgi:lysyl-tRNA synthetase class 2
LAERLRHERNERGTADHLDERFLAAMQAGLPDCAGVAVGFDCVVMLALGLPDISATQAFGWNQA